MTKKRFYYNWRTGRMKDIQSNSHATSNMRIIERLINDACYGYERKIKKLEEENASMKGRIINAMIKSNQVECNCTTCVCEDYVNEELKKW